MGLSYFQLVSDMANARHVFSLAEVYLEIWFGLFGVGRLFFHFVVPLPKGSRLICKILVVW